MLKESFPQAAARHLQDAKILLNKERWDNAVYLAGYVVECSFKVLVEIYIPEGKKAVKKYGHDLTELQGTAMDRLRVIYPVLMQLPSDRTMGTVLAKNHPERRYYQSGIRNQTQAEEAVNRAEEIYQEIIPKLVLDGKISSEEL